MAEGKDFEQLTASISGAVENRTVETDFLSCDTLQSSSITSEYISAIDSLTWWRDRDSIDSLQIWIQRWNHTPPEKQPRKNPLNWRQCSQNEHFRKQMSNFRLGKRSINLYLVVLKIWDRKREYKPPADPALPPPSWYGPMKGCDG